MRYVYDWLKKKHGGVFYGFIISYIIVICIPILIGGGAWFALMNNFSEEVERIHRSMLKQIQIAGDEQFTVVERMSQQLSINPYVGQLLLVNQPNMQANYNITEIASEISNLKSVHNTLIDDCYIYFEGPKIIVNSSLKLSPELFYSYVNSYEGMDYDEWQRKILRNEKRVIFAQEMLEQQSIKYETILISRALVNGGRQTGRHVIHLKQDYLKSLISEIENINRSIIGITDSEGQILFSSEDSDIFKVYDGGGQVSFNNEIWKAEETNSDSLMPGLKYIMFTPESDLKVKVNRMRKLIFITLALITLFGCAFIIFFARKNYKPIGNLITNLERLNSKKKGYDEEYFYIMECLRSMEEERNAMLQTIGDQSEMVKDRFLVELLKGNTEDAALGGGIQLFPTDDSESYFSVAVLSDSEKKFSGDEVKVINRLSEQLLYSRCTQIKGEIVLIVCYADYGYVWELLNEYIRRTMKKLDGLGHTNISVGIGGIQNKSIDISISYRQAKVAAKKAAENGGGTIYFHNIEFEGTGGFYYPIEIEERILTYIKNGEAESAKKLLYDIIYNNIDRNEMDNGSRLLLQYGIIGTVSRIIFGVTEEGGFEGDDADYCRRMFAAEDFEAFMTILDEFFASLSKLCENKKIGHGQGLKNRIEAYVAEHYNQTSFSLSSMADYFDVTPSYFSRYFKEYFGENFNTYIARYKIEKSKEMLCETSYAIKEISALVGYWDVNNFIKTFKRLEGTTPGQYRANNSGKKPG